MEIICKELWNILFSGTVASSLSQRHLLRLKLKHPHALVSRSYNYSRRSPAAFS